MGLIFNAFIKYIYYDYTRKYIHQILKSFYMWENQHQ